MAATQKTSPSKPRRIAPDRKPAKVDRGGRGEEEERDAPGARKRKREKRKRGKEERRKEERRRRRRKGRGRRRKGKREEKRKEEKRKRGKEERREKEEEEEEGKRKEEERKEKRRGGARAPSPAPASSCTAIVSFSRGQAIYGYLTRRLTAPGGTIGKTLTWFAHGIIEWADVQT